MAKNQIGNIKVTKDYVLKHLKELVGDRQISGAPGITQIRGGVSPYSTFYRGDISFKDESQASVFVKDISDERRDLTGKLPSGGKLIENEVRFLEFGNEYGAHTPRLYAVDNYAEQNGDKITKHTVLFMEDFKESLEGVLLRLGEESDSPNTELKVFNYLREAIMTVLDNSRLATKHHYKLRDNMGNLTVHRITMEELEAEIRQAVSSLILYKFGQGNQTLTLDQGLDIVDWCSRYDVSELEETLKKLVAKPLAESQENILFNLDMHLNNVMLDSDKSHKFAFIDNSKFGEGPLAVAAASLIYQPKIYGLLSQKRRQQLAEHALLEYERLRLGVKEVGLEDIDVDKRKRFFEEEIPAAARYVLLRGISFFDCLRLYYPENADALIKLNPSFRDFTNKSIEVLASLDDPLTKYFENGVGKLMTLKVNGNH